MDTEYGYSYGQYRNPMATAAVVLGVISLITCLVFYISVPCGAMAVLLAILSRGRNPMPGKGKTGLVCGLIGMILSVVITLSSVWVVLSNAQMRAYMESYMQYYLGDASFDLDRELGRMFPALKDALGLDDSETDRSYPADDNSNGTDDENRAVGGDGSDDAPVRPSRQLPDEEGEFI